MRINGSPSFSPTSPNLSIGFPSSMDSIRSTSSQRPGSASQGSTCAYPSWPSVGSLRSHSSSSGGGGFSSSFRNSGSSYISDAELFGLDELEEDGRSSHSRTYLSQAPSPPRQYAAVPTRALPLAPLYPRPAKSEKKRTKSPRKQSKPAQMMTPISESPETPE